jgi:hypothetical protein
MDWRNLFDIPLGWLAKCSMWMLEFKCIFEPFYFKFAREMLRDFWSTDIDQVDASLDPKSLPVWRKRATFPAHDTKFVNRNEVISSI